MPILYLILGHLIADFPLQPLHLVKWKIRSDIGLLIHVKIHFLTYLWVLYPYLSGKWVLLSLFTLSLVHFGIDKVKIICDKKRGAKKARNFILDQSAHLVTLIGTGWVIMGLDINPAALPKAYYFNEVYMNPWPVLLLSGLIVVVYVMRVFRIVEKGGIV